MDWLEEEWKAAVAVHLNNLAKQSQISAVSSTGSKPLGKTEVVTTDMGLISGTLLALQDRDKPAQGVQGGLNAGSGTEIAIPKGPVTSSDVADQITSKRLETVKAKKLDLCPLCKKQHFFDRKWLKVSPPKTTQMLSTHFVILPKVLCDVGCRPGEDYHKPEQVSVVLGLGPQPSQATWWSTSWRSKMLT